MALSASNTHSLYTPLHCVLSQRPSKSLKFNTLVLQFHHHHLPRLVSSKPISVFSIPNSFPLKNSSIGSSFEASLTVQDSAFQTGDEDKSHDINISEAAADQKHTSSLKSLIKVYREAILDGDESTIADIEAMILTVENEKNKLVEKVSALSVEITSGKEKYLRLQADFDNFRKRSEKERLTTRNDAQGEVIESLLPMVDNFERAKQQLKLETENEKKIDASYQGIYKQFVEIMKSLHVSAVPTVGKPFDPSMHEAIAREESEEFKEGIVIQEFRRGFLLGERLLRPAMVKVSAGPGKRKFNVSPQQPATAAGVDERKPGWPHNAS